jgi:hypothetical protein
LRAIDYLEAQFFILIEVIEESLVDGAEAGDEELAHGTRIVPSCGTRLFLPSHQKCDDVPVMAVAETALPDKSAMLLSAVYPGVWFVVFPVEAAPETVPRVRVNVYVEGFQEMVEFVNVIVDVDV